MTKWFVSRQHYWHSGDLVVEIAGGGLDYANADMLCDKYPKLGEGQEYDDPREAVRAAIAIRDAWNKDESETARVEAGFTGGWSMPFEEEPTDEDLIAWAQKEWESIPKCPGCGEPMYSDERYGHQFTDEYEFCSQSCAEKDYEAIMADWEEDEIDEREWD